MSRIERLRELVAAGGDCDVAWPERGSWSPCFDCPLKITKTEDWCGKLTDEATQTDGPDGEDWKKAHARLSLALCKKWLAEEEMDAILKDPSADELLPSDA